MSTDLAEAEVVVLTPAELIDGVISELESARAVSPATASADQASSGTMETIAALSALMTAVGWEAALQQRELAHIQAHPCVTGSPGVSSLSRDVAPDG
jgi:hypothetical protein